MRHLSRGGLRRLTTMLDYAQTLHSVMHDITSTLPVGVNLPLGFNAKWPPHVNRRRAPGVLRLGCNGYVLIQLVNEFLSEQKQNLAPATFNMNSLLKEMQEIEDVRMREAPQRGGDKLPQ